MKLLKYTLLIILLLSSISCSSDNKIDDGFTEIAFNVDENLLSNTPEMIENIFQVKFPVDFNKIDDINFQAIKTAIDSDTTSFFQLSLLAVYKSLSGSSSILSKIISDKNVFNEIDSTYYNMVVDNFRTKNINQGKIKINGIKTVQYIITAQEVVLIKLLINVKGFYYQLDYIIPLSKYEEKLRGIESSIGSIFEIKEDK
jgi:hypothetical protein